jgi:hypothetical protein
MLFEATSFMERKWRAKDFVFDFILQVLAVVMYFAITSYFTLRKTA